MAENLNGASLAEGLGTQGLLHIAAENPNWGNLHQEQLGKNQSKLKKGGTYLACGVFGIRSVAAFCDIVFAEF